MLKLEQIEGVPAYLSEQEELCLAVETVPIDSLLLTPHLEQRFPKDYDPAIIQQLALTINNDLFFPHALVVKEVSDGSKVSHLELLHKPAVVFALKQCGLTNLDVVVIHNHETFDLNTATDWQLLFLGQNGALIDHLVRDIPITDVVSEESIVDEEHRDILKDQLSTGQQVNIWVRPRSKGDRLVFDIVDGYHRTDALREIGAQFIEARLAFGMTNEELFDERVRAAARSAKAVKFPRMITSMQLSYLESPWSQLGLKLSQILNLAVSSPSTKHPGKNLGLTEAESRAAISWAIQKADLWNSDVGSLCQQIRCAENSFPEIIGQVRTSQGGGHIGDGVFNPVKFFAMVEELSNNLHLQQLMVAIIKKHNLNTDQVRVVSQALAKIEGQTELVEQLMSNPCDLDILSSILGKKVVYVKGKMSSRSTSDKATPEVAPDLELPEFEPLTSTLDDLAPIEVVIADAAKDDVFQIPFEDIPPEEIEPVTSFLISTLRPVQPMPKKDDQTYNIQRTTSYYEAQIVELQLALEAANKQLALGNGRQTAWYESLATLTPEEREMMRYIKVGLQKGIDISQINAVLKRRSGLTDNQLNQLKKSALAKWSLFLEDLLQDTYTQIV